MKTILDEYELQENHAMICGSAEAESRKYMKYRSKSNGRIYLVADQPNAGDNIYVEGEKGSDGFAGRELTFTLVDGSTIKLKGPWHTNSNDLLKATGIDCTWKHLTWGLVAHSCTGGCNKPLVFKDVFHLDDEPMVGAFDRIQKIAQRIANELRITVQAYSKSTGGSFRGPVDPS